MSEESERPTGILGAYVVFHDKLSGLYAGLGAFITRHTLWTCLGGILFFGCLTIGLVAAKKETDLEKLWIQTGTRITPEKEFYEAWFGGLTRKQNIAIIDKTNPSVVASTTNLDNWKALLTPLLAEDESTTSDGGLTGSTVGATGLIPNSVSVPKQIKLQSSIGRTGLTPLSATYTQKDFCEAPPVPTVFKPGGSIALAYINIVKCVNAVYPGRLAGNLPPNWGIDRFPCTRTVVLDCFREGNFDYPLRLQQLDFVAGTMFGMYSNTSYNLQNLCVVPTVTALVNASLYAATGNPNIPVAVIQANSNYVALLAGVKSAITNFAGFGYLWRASYATAGDLNKYMYKAITNTKSGLPVTTLIGGRLPSCMTWSASKVGEQLYGGGITIDDAGATVTVAATRMVANNYNSDHPVFAKQIAQGSKGLQSGSSNDRKDLCEAWEGLWQDYLLPKWEKDPNSGYSVGEAASNLNLYFAAWRATDDTIRDGSSTEGGLIIGGYIIIIVYSCVCVSKLSWPCSVVNAVYSRVGLALWGVAAVALATIASFGMMGIIGVNLSPISINLVPFLALGIGIDDMYVLVHTTIYYNTEKTVLSRMKVVFSKCGPAILLTTMSNVVSFFIASITPMRVVQSFAIQMGFALLFNHLTLFFVFGPGLAWDLRRIMLKRTDLFTPPCIELEKPIPAEDDPSISTSGNFITNITAQYIAPACCLWWVKILVFCVIYGFMAATIWNGVVNTQKGLRLSDIALRGTFVREYTDVQEQYFGSYDSYYVTKTVDYTNLGVQQRFVKVIQQLDLSKYRLDAMHTTDLSFFTSSFLPAFNSANTASSTTVYPGAAFYPAFQSYITSTGATRVPEVGCADKTTLAPVGCELFNAANHIVTATKNTIYNKDLFADTQIFLDTMADNRYIADFYSEGDGFMFGFIYQFYQQYTDIDTNLYKVVGYSLIGVFGVAVIFTFSPIASLIMCLVILQVVVQLWGFLAWIDVKLNAFSVVNLSMTVGICVEFTGYVTHSFCVAHGTKNRRMAFAMEEMMAPMANGLLSTFLAVLVLIGARFPFFRKYYFAMFSLQTLIGFVNGMIVLPIWLSLLGPRSMHYKKGEDDQFAGEQGMGMKRLETHDTSQATLTV